MTDLLLVVITIAFFGIAALLVRGCDAIIGSDEDSEVATDHVTGTIEEVAA